MIGPFSALFGRNRTAEHGIEAYRQGCIMLPWKIWTKLAYKGDLDCLAILGVLRQEDIRIPHRPNGLFYWYADIQKKTGDIHPYVINNIGAAYANGLKIPVDYDSAYIHFSIASSHNDELAEINLQKMLDDECEVSNDVKTKMDEWRAQKNESNE